jgi:hypothetical protein
MDNVKNCDSYGSILFKLGLKDEHDPLGYIKSGFLDHLSKYTIFRQNGT